MKTCRFGHSIVRTLLILSVVSIMPRPASAGTDVWSGGGGSGNLFWLSAANWQADTLPLPGDQLVFTNAVGLVNSNNYPTAFTFGGITFATPAGGYTLNGRSITLTNNITDLQVVTPETINLPLIVNAGSNLTVNVTANGELDLDNVISGSGGLTNSGAGALVLHGSNTFAGPLVINAGIVKVNQETNLPAAPTNFTAGNIVINGGTLQARAGFELNTNRGITLGPDTGSGQGTISVNSESLIPDDTTTLTNGSIMANNGGGTGGLTKLGFGNLVLFGANTYTGTTSNEVGTLTLDFTQPTSPANNIINSASSLVLGGANAGAGVNNFAQLTVNGAASVVNSQAFTATHVTIGNGVVQTINGASGTMNVDLGALDHDVGGTLTIVPAAAGSLHTSSANVNGILGGWAFISSGASSRNFYVATNWASVDGSGNIVNFNDYMVYSSASTFMKDSMNAVSNIYVTGLTTSFTNDVDGANSTNDVNSIVFNACPPASVLLSAAIISSALASSAV